METSYLIIGKLKVYNYLSSGEITIYFLVIGKLDPKSIV